MFAALFVFICATAVQAAFPTAKGAKQATVVTPVTAPSEKAVSNQPATPSVKSVAAAKHTNFGGGKSKTVAAVLAFFLGGLGVHSFYMGKTTKGFAQLGLYIAGIALYAAGISATISSGTVSGVAVVGLLLILGVGIWAFVDFVRILSGGLEPEEGWDS